MGKPSTLTLVAVAAAALVGATIAHAYLLSPRLPVADVATRTSPMVTIVQGSTGGISAPPAEVSGRATPPVAVAQSEPNEGGLCHLFGPRGLPARMHSLLWHGASLDGWQSARSTRFITLVADTTGITCDQLWARPTAGAGTTGAAYFTLTNNGPPDQLIGASTPIAASADLHETINDNGVMRMRPVTAIALAPGKTVTFSPGGYHVMLTGLKAPLKAGDSFPLTLSFAHAQPITVTVKVQTGSTGMGHPSMPGMPGMH